LCTFLCFVDRASRCNRVKKNHLMHNLFLVYFVNLYMFRPYLGPSSGGKPYVYNNWYLLFFLDDCLLSWMDWNNTPRTTDNHVKRIKSTNCCIHTAVPPDDGPGCTRNMNRLTKYAKNKLHFLCTCLYLRNRFWMFHCCFLQDSFLC
jgi:hypothetical protein